MRLLPPLVPLSQLALQLGNVLTLRLQLMARCSLRRYLARFPRETDLMSPVVRLLLLHRLHALPESVLPGPSHWTRFHRGAIGKCQHTPRAGPRGGPPAGAAAVRDPDGPPPCS